MSSTDFTEVRSHSLDAVICLISRIMIQHQPASEHLYKALQPREIEYNVGSVAPFYLPHYTGMRNCNRDAQRASANPSNCPKLACCASLNTHCKGTRPDGIMAMMSL